MLSGLLLTGGVTLTVCVLLVFIDRRVGNERTLDHDVASSIFSMVGVLYAILLAFVVVQVWQADQDAQTNSQAEASEVSQIYFTARALPEPQRSQLMKLARSYAETVARQEWPLMTRGQVSAVAVSSVARMRTTILAYQPKDYRGQILMSQTLDAINQLVESRRKRTAGIQNPVPTVLWIGLIAGGVISVGFTLSFGYGRLFHQMLMVAAVTALLTFTLWLVLQMSHPFYGPVKVGPDAFDEVIDKFNKFP